VATILRRIPFTVTKDKSGGDTSQIPTAANIHCFRRGVTLAASATFTSGQVGIVLTVRDTGDAGVGDTLAVYDASTASGLSAATLTVTSVPSPTSIIANSNSNGADDRKWLSSYRVLLANLKPTPYVEGSGTVSTTWPILASATNGAAEVYLKCKVVDAITTGSGFAPRLDKDIISGDDRNWVATDYASIQDAIDAAPSGSVVYIPLGTYYENLTINKPLTLKGDGRYSILTPTNGSPGIDITITADHVTLRDFCIMGQASGYSASGYGIKIDSSASPNEISQIKLDGVVIAQVGSHGIYANAVNFITIHDTNSQDNYGSGFYFYACAQVNMSHMYGIRNRDYGAYFGLCLGVQVIGTIGFEDNNYLSQINGYIWAGPPTSAWVSTPKTFRDWSEIKFRECTGVTAHRVNIENFSHSLTKTGMVIDTCNGVSTGGCSFILAPALSAGTRGIFVIAGGSIHIGPNNGYSVETMVGLDEGGPGATPFKIVIDPQTGGVVSQCVVPPIISQRAGSEIINLNGGIQVPIYTTVGRPTATTNLTGTLYYDSTTNKLMVCDHTPQWRTVTMT